MCNIYLFTGKYWLFQKFLIKINVPNQRVVADLPLGK
jgi:hypothetical protein